MFHGVYPGASIRQILDRVLHPSHGNGVIEYCIRCRYLDGDLTRVDVLSSQKRVTDVLVQSLAGKLAPLGGARVFARAIWVVDAARTNTPCCDFARQVSRFNRC